MMKLIVTILLILVFASCKKDVLMGKSEPIMETATERAYSVCFVFSDGISITGDGSEENPYVWTSTGTGCAPSFNGLTGIGCYFDPITIDTTAL